MLRNLLSALWGDTVQMLARSALKIAGTALVTWLIARHVDPTQASNFAEALSGVAMTGLGIWLSQRNAQTGKAKTEVAASAGVSLGQQIEQAKAAGALEQHQADQARLDAITQALATAAKAAPKTKAELLAALAGGGQ